MNNSGSFLNQGLETKTLNALQMSSFINFFNDQKNQNDFKEFFIHSLQKKISEGSLNQRDLGFGQNQNDKTFQKEEMGPKIQEISSEHG